MTRTILAAMLLACQSPPQMVVYTQCHTGDGIAEACVERADGAYLLPDCEWLTIKMVSRDYCMDLLTHP